jgi:hypothetical protein
MSNMKKTLIGIGLMFLLAGAGIFFYQYRSGAATYMADAASSTGATVIATESVPPVIPTGYKEYKNDQYHFSVDYPEGLAPQEFHDSGPGLIVSFQSGAGQEGFQIYVAPVNGTQVTPERFKLDEPSGVMKDAVDTTVDGMVAKKFTSLDSSLGETWEIWFIKDGFLYEVTTYKQLDSWLDGIMQTWKFL